jgi:hypothetical protein
MPKRGRPKGSGYRSQILILWVLMTARDNQYCYTELVKKTHIHRDRVNPNVTALMNKGLVRRQQKGHMKFVTLSSVDEADAFILQRFIKSGVRDAESSPNRKTTQATDSSSVVDGRIIRLKYQPILECAVYDSRGLTIDDRDYAVDKELGIITFKNPPKELLKIVYRAGYQLTPAAVRQACLTLVSGQLRWIKAIIENNSERIRKIPLETFEIFDKLLSPFKKEHKDAIRDIILASLKGSVKEIRNLEKDGLSIYENYGKLPKYVEEVKFIEDEKKKSMQPQNFNWKSLKGEGKPKTIKPHR